MIDYNIFCGTAGSNVLTDYSLVNLDALLNVEREGIQYNIIYSGTPTSRQVVYDRAAGSLTFLVDFTYYAGGAVDIPAEKIYVLYRN